MFFTRGGPAVRSNCAEGPIEVSLLLFQTSHFAREPIDVWGEPGYRLSLNAALILLQYRSRRAKERLHFWKRLFMCSPCLVLSPRMLMTQSISRPSHLNDSLTEPHFYKGVAAILRYNSSYNQVISAGVSFNRSPIWRKLISLREFGFRAD